MAERIDKKEKVNSVWSWVKDIFNQVDIDEPKFLILKELVQKKKPL